MVVYIPTSGSVPIRFCGTLKKSPELQQESRETPMVDGLGHEPRVVGESAPFSPEKAHACMQACRHAFQNICTYATSLYMVH